MKNRNNNNAKGKNMMTKTQALAYIADELQTVMDDDYPDVQEILVVDLCDLHGFEWEEAEELVYGEEWI